LVSDDKSNVFLMKLKSTMHRCVSPNDGHYDTRVLCCVSHPVRPWTRSLPSLHDFYDTTDEKTAQRMSEQFPSTLRPAAPGRLRRSLTEKSSDAPPPPYETPETSLGVPHKRTISTTSASSNVGSPVTATAQLLGIDLDGQREWDKTITEEYISEHSRDELTKLLLKAEAVIRARERGESALPACTRVCHISALP
jgi:hypothetical protein